MICMSKYFPNKQARMKIYCTCTHANTHSCTCVLCSRTLQKHQKLNEQDNVGERLEIQLLIFDNFQILTSLSTSPSLSFVIPSSSLPSSSSASPSVSPQFSFNCVLSHLIPLRIKRRKNCEGEKRMMGKETESDGEFNPFRSDGTWKPEDVTHLNGTNDYKSAHPPLLPLRSPSSFRRATDSKFQTSLCSQWIIKTNASSFGSPAASPLFLGRAAIYEFLQ